MTLVPHYVPPEWFYQNKSIAHTPLFSQLFNLENKSRTDVVLVCMYCRVMMMMYTLFIFPIPFLYLYTLSHLCVFGTLVLLFPLLYVFFFYRRLTQDLIMIMMTVMTYLFCRDDV